MTKENKFESYKINVLGTTYTIVFKTENEDLALENCVGYCDETIKEIVIKKGEPTKNSVSDLNKHYTSVIKHELIHAFIFESGLDHNSEWALNEEMTSWVSRQFDKINEAYKEIKPIVEVRVND